jgi:hypothetical protein
MNTSASERQPVQFLSGIPKGKARGSIRFFEGHMVLLMVGTILRGVPFKLRSSQVFVLAHLNGTYNVFTVAAPAPAGILFRNDRILRSDCLSLE